MLARSQIWIGASSYATSQSGNFLCTQCASMKTRLTNFCLKKKTKNKCAVSLLFFFLNTILCAVTLHFFLISLFAKYIYMDLTNFVLRILHFFLKTNMRI